MNQSSAPCGRYLRLLLLLLLACLAMSAALPVGAQSTDDDADDAGETQETLPEAYAIELDSIVLLQFRTYEKKWVRYINSDGRGNRLLEIDDISEFPFRSVSLDLRVTMEDLETPYTLGNIVTAEGMEYAEDLMDGVCDTEALAKLGTSDILCKPGSSVMSPGHAISVLYHPDTGDIVAVTTSVDNSGGAATNLKTQPVAAAPPARPASEAPAAAAPAGNATTGTCGPWSNNQWLPASEFWASGLDLPVDYSQIGGEQPDFFICVVPGDGSSPYLRAGVDSEPTPTATSSPSSSSDDDDGDGGGGTGCPDGTSIINNADGTTDCGTDF